MSSWRRVTAVAAVVWMSAAGVAHGQQGSAAVIVEGGGDQHDLLEVALRSTLRGADQRVLGGSAVRAARTHLVGESHGDITDEQAVLLREGLGVSALYTITISKNGDGPNSVMIRAVRPTGIARSFLEAHDDELIEQVVDATAGMAASQPQVAVSTPTTAVGPAPQTSVVVVQPTAPAVAQPVDPAGAAPPPQRTTRAIAQPERKSRAGTVALQLTAGGTYRFWSAQGSSEVIDGFAGGPTALLGIYLGEKLALVVGGSGSTGQLEGGVTAHAYVLGGGLQARMNRWLSSVYAGVAIQEFSSDFGSVSETGFGFGFSNTVLLGESIGLNLTVEQAALDQGVQYHAITVGLGFAR